MLDGSMAANNSRDSPSVTALPPDEGVEMADVDSEQNEQWCPFLLCVFHTFVNIISKQDRI